MFNQQFLKNTIKDIFGCDSPSGYYHNINLKLKEILTSLGYQVKFTNKGLVEVFIEGKSHEKTVATSAHVDTLGLMVRSINADGTLRVTNIGGPLIPSLDGEYCKIVTRDNRVYHGTILSTSPSVHVFEDAKSKPRDINNIVVRIDEVIKSKADVEALGINNGDYIMIDPKTVITESNFLKSRFIDDKGSVCVLLTVLEYMSKNKIKPSFDTYIYFVNYEEVGHGAATVSDKIDEFVTVDMGCVGLDLAGNEHLVSICAKDSGGPYNYELTTRLINLAKDNDISYCVDIYPMYGSDVGAAYHAGKNLKGALIGPCVAASHGMERTHFDALNNTMKLIFLYLTK